MGMKRTNYRTPPAVARVRMRALEAVPEAAWSQEDRAEYALAAFICTRHAFAPFPAVALAIGFFSLISIVCALAPILS